MPSNLTEVRAAIQRVRDLHRANEHFPYYCITCRRPMPCSTLRALDGPVQ